MTFVHKTIIKTGLAPIQVLRYCECLVLALASPSVHHATRHWRKGLEWGILEANSKFQAWFADYFFCIINHYAYRTLVTYLCAIGLFLGAKSHFKLVLIFTGGKFEPSNEKDFSLWKNIIFYWINAFKTTSHSLDQLLLSAKNCFSVTMQQTLMRLVLGTSCPCGNKALIIWKHERFHFFPNAFF